MNTDFKDIEISDRQWVNSLLSYSDYRSTEYNFTVLYIWKDTYKTKIARLDDFLLIRSGECETGFAYIFPAGRGERCGPRLIFLPLRRCRPQEMQRPLPGAGGPGRSLPPPLITIWVGDYSN